MKKLLLILLCLPMIFSCGDTEKVKDLEDRISELENKKKNKDEGIFSKEIVKEVDIKNESLEEETLIVKTEEVIHQEAEKAKEEIIESTELHNLQNDPAEIEEFAREKFLMKKENEDIFIKREKKPVQKESDETPKNIITQTTTEALVVNETEIPTEEEEETLTEEEVKFDRDEDGVLNDVERELYETIQKVLWENDELLGE
jgi:hypothetical protein